MNSSKALLLTLFLSLLLIVQNASATGSRSSLLAPSVERRAIRGIPRLLETLPPPSESSDFADYLLNERDSANQLLFDLVRNRKHVSLSDWESHLKQIIVTPGFFHQLTNSGFNVALQQLRERTEPPPFIHKQEEALAEFRTWGDVFANKTARSM